LEKDRASWVWATPEISPVSSGTPMSHMVSRDTEIRVILLASVSRAATRITSAWLSLP